MTIQATGAITWGYTSARLFPLAADTPLEIPVGPEPGDPTPHVESLWIKSDSGTPTVYLDCSPYRR